MNREPLKTIMQFIASVRPLSTTIAADDANRDNVCKLVNALIDAESAALDLWEARRIQPPAGLDTDPLSDVEELFYDSLNNHLKFSDEQFSELTEAQKFMAARVMARNIPLSQAFISDHLGLKFPHIYIGIEPDGYTHS